MKRLGGDPKKINPLVPVDLVIDHSVQVDVFGNAVALERKRRDRVRAQRRALRVPALGPEGVPQLPRGAARHGHRAPGEPRVPGPTVVWEKGGWLYPDSVVGTDSHTTMINGLGVVGWGVGGIEAEAVMLGQPIYMLTPRVVGCRLVGALPEGVTATDLVLTVTQVLRKKGVVDKFVEFFGPGLARCRWPTARRSPTWPPSTARRWASSRSTPETLDYLRLDRPRREADRAGRGLLRRSRGCSARRRRRTRVHGHARAGPVDDRAAPGGPEASAGPRA